MSEVGLFYDEKGKLPSQVSPVEEDSKLALWIKNNITKSKLDNMDDVDLRDWKIRKLKDVVGIDPVERKKCPSTQTTNDKETHPSPTHPYNSYKTNVVNVEEFKLIQKDTI